MFQAAHVHAKPVPPAEKTRRSAQPPPESAINPLWGRLALGIQPKLAVSAPDDPFEREADRVADSVMRMPEPVVQRKCAACSAGGATCPSCEEEEARVQRKADGANGGGEVSSDFASRFGRGASLDRANREFFGSRFGRDFGDVRVHTGPEAAAAAQSIQARAFTLGRDIVFGAGEYAPGSALGKRLLAHELTHVVQQSGTAPRGVFRQPAGAPAPLARAQFEETLRRRFAVAEIRTGTREEQANSLNVQPEELPNWQSWAPGDPSPTYASILEAFEHFAASFGGTPNVRELVFLRTHYERSPQGQMVAASGTGGYFSSGKLVLFRVVETGRKALPIARSNAAGNYPSVTLGVTGPGSTPGAPIPLPTAAENARRIVIHELGHGLAEAVLGPAYTPLDPTMMNAYRFAAGWTRSTPHQLYDVGVREVEDHLLLGSTPPARYHIEEGNWNSPNWVEQPVSGYMVSGGPGEDFAEAVMAYVEDPALLRSRSPHRYQFLDDHKDRWRSRLLRPRPNTPGPRGSGVALGIYLVVEDPESAPLAYHRLTPYENMHDRGVIVEVWHDSSGYYYPYHGRRIPLPERP